MKISDLNVGNFGVWQGLDVSHLSDRVTVIYGQNEAGKSTLMQFIRTVFYGFSPERRRYMLPQNPGIAGGKVQITAAAGKYTIERRLDPHSGSGLGNLAVYNAEGSPQGTRIMEMLLGGLDESIFNNVFAIGLDEIQQLSLLDDTDAARLLYDLTFGLDRVSLLEVMRELEASRTRLIANDGNAGQIFTLSQERERLRRKLEDQGQHTRRWQTLARQRNELDGNVEELADQMAGIERQMRLVETAQRVAVRWRERRQLQRELAQAGPVPELAPGIVEKLNRTIQRIKQTDESIQFSQLQCRELKERIGKLGINDGLWRCEARIEILAQQQDWIAGLDAQQQSLLKEIDTISAQLKEERQKVGLTLPTGQSFNLTPKTLEPLKAAAQKLIKEKRKIKDSGGEIEVHRQTANKIQEELAKQIASRGEKELPPAIDKAGKAVAALRQRLTMEDRLEQLNRNRQDLDDEIETLVQRQVLPLEAMVMLGAGVAFSFMFVLLGMFGGWFMPLSTATAVLLVFLGLGGLVVCAAIKFHMERSASLSLATVSKQREALQAQLDKANEERDFLDKQLPRDKGGPIISRLKSAEQELQMLEDLVPMEAKLQAALAEAEAAEQKVNHSGDAYKSALHQWKAALKLAGLPGDTTPKVLQLFTQEHKSVSDLDKRLNNLKSDLEQRRREAASVAARIDKMFEEVALTPEASGNILRLKQLIRELAEQKQMIHLRGTMRKEFRTHRSNLRKLAEDARVARRKKKRILRSAKVADEHELRLLAQRVAGLHELERRCQAIGLEIATTIDGHASEAAMIAILDDPTMNLSNKLVEHGTAHEMLRQKQVQLIQQRGELTEQIRTLAADRQWADLRLELASVEQSLADATERWQVLAVTSSLIDTIRELYRTERQPESLREASAYLSLLTDGKYKRVWTPLGENVLRVDTLDGQSLSMEALSRGTREQVYLSLRLSLASSYGRKGAVLPLILDDVLVNFDSHRARLAAKVLRAFADEGHQLILFTCHEHLVSIFREVNAEVRELPVRGGEVLVQEPPKKKKRPEIIVHEPQPTPPAPVMKKKKPEPEPVAVVELPIVEAIEEPVHADWEAPRAGDEWETASGIAEEYLEEEADEIDDRWNGESEAA